MPERAGASCGGFGEYVDQEKVVLDIFGQFLIGGVVLQHVQDKVFFYGLTHGIEAEWLVLAIGTLASEELKRFMLRCSGKSEETGVGDAPAFLHILYDAVLQVFWFLTLTLFRLLQA
jgi:hypothetical protein